LRNQSKLDQLLADGRAMGVDRIETALCDFSLQADTQRLVRDLVGRGDKIDVLIDDVGLLSHAHHITSEGREHTFAADLLRVTTRCGRRASLRGDAFRDGPALGWSTT